MVSNSSFKYGDIVNIYIPGYAKSSEKMEEYFKIRYSDNSPYFTISDKVPIYNYKSGNPSIIIPEESGFGPEIICAKGDCYTSKYYQRI